MIAVSIERNRQLQQRRDQTHAEAVLPSTVSPTLLRAVGRNEKRLVHLWKEVVKHDEDGKDVGLNRVLAGPVTVLRIEVVDLADLGRDAAEACGFKTPGAFRNAWQVKHPRSPRVAVLWFALGDWRDRDRFLGWAGRRAGSDDKGYTLNPRRALDPDAPVPDEVAAAYASANRQKDDARRGHASQAMATETPSQRMLRLERAVDRMGAEARRAIRQELRIIEQRLVRAEKKVA